MSLPFLTLFALSTLGLVSFTRAADTPPAATTPAPKAAPKKHYLIVLRLAPRLHDDKAWTDTDKATVGAHFQRLKSATDAGQVVMAGRTPVAADKTMGLVVFSAPDEAAAKAFMEGDPCVASGMMLAELQPFDLALLRK